ncbi:MAG: histidine kinase [Sulfobacillus thermosulfidooxidans]|nr:MAG: histidine kinase [Sulfobacillus thermosulfidooxidans]
MRKQRLVANMKPKWRVLPRHWLEWADLRTFHHTGSWRGYVIATGLVAMLTMGLWLGREALEPVNIGFLYLLPVLFSALRWGLWTALYTALLGVMAFDFFFVPPIFSYAVSDLRYIWAFAVFFVVGAVTATLTTSLQQQAEDARRRARVIASLYELSRRIAAGNNLQEVVAAVTHHVQETLGVAAWVVLPDGSGRFPGSLTAFLPPRESLNRGVLQWVYQHGEPVGFGQRHKPELLYLPLKTEDTIHGVMCLGEYGHGHQFTDDERQTIEAITGLAAVSVARVQYEEAARKADLMAESERLHAALLDSISHELKTPLTMIMGAVDHLVKERGGLPDDQRTLLMNVRSGVWRMNRVITNLLGMVRIESGMLRLNCQPCDASDLIGVVLRQLSEVLITHPVSVTIPDDVSPLWVDEILIEQALVNVLSNAAKYSADGSPIEIACQSTDSAITIAVKDWGIGIVPGEEEKLFQKFYRSSSVQHISGTGLGLAICDGIVRAHGGRVVATRNQPTGTIMTIELPRVSEGEPLQERGRQDHERGRFDH